MKLRSNRRIEENQSLQQNSLAAITEENAKSNDGHEVILMPLDSSHHNALSRQTRTPTDGASPKRTPRRILSSILDSPRTTLRKSGIAGKRPCVRDPVDNTVRPDSHYQAQGDPIAMDVSNDTIPFNRKSNFRERPIIERRQRSVLSWIHDEAPTDLIPKIFSYAGPQTVAVLSSLNKSWRSLCMTEPVWKTLCEEYGKWNPEHDPLPSQVPTGVSTDKACSIQNNLVWKKYYCDNPIVPIDFKTIKGALKAVSSKDDSSNTNSLDGLQNLIQKRHVRILLCPGRHIISRQLLIRAKNSSVITLETLQRSYAGSDCEPKSPQCTSPLPSSACMACSICTDPSQLSLANLPPSPSRIRDTIRNFLICRSTVDIAFEASCANMDLFSSPPLRHGRATIILHTSNANEPVVRVQSGTFHLRQVDLVHSCQGQDIWNGNAALQVQPEMGPNHTPIRMVYPDIPPTVLVEDADIMSFSGRGIVSIDGGKSTIRNCFIHDCAATGIYVGGLGSSASINLTDILHNGHGNRRSRRGIGRGHSGVYLEQGVVSLSDCNVSQNSLTGISAVSHHNATMLVENSDLQGNGTLQLELPPIGTESRGRCVSKDNVITSHGTGRRRSTVTPATVIHTSRLLDNSSPRHTPESNGPHVVYPLMYVEM